MLNVTFWACFLVEKKPKLYIFKTLPFLVINLSESLQSIVRILFYCRFFSPSNTPYFFTAVFSYTRELTFPFSSSLPARPQINNRNYGKSPYLTQSFPEEHWLMCTCFLCVFCVFQWVCVSDIYLFVYVFGTWVNYLVEWWRRPVVIVRPMMCDMRTMLIFLFLRYKLGAPHLARLVVLSLTGVFFCFVFFYIFKYKYWSN